ncbi:hypothetical protein M406DRAFT_342380 [Cryphonectria parasitica EP155]|uniref:Regulatory protein alcR n=1 Tax=Cryphonectria parasitica (strain ATCC 38755 / EP155) TaxID=660469 RepID=A0A9P5CJV2_CRYP1|nr:uncharacterized protein M406DRAFT_342380 [Cryphonectria parasitica EP155]KAF3761614.1 hypothetical protein M406DRAFT_342380 [Cryphonectria parasitica EP155]
MPWALTSDARLARAANGNMIGETMMKIYHDVWEGALSCWLTEQSCPYNTIAISSALHIPDPLRRQQQQLWATLEDMQREWGPNWSNRVYRRVTKLDQKAHLLGLRRLRPADERRVATALNAVVMAFTAQWAQASRRSSARWAPGTAPDGSDQPPDLDLGDEFDRTLQKSFWNQARRALDDCGEIDSFRVVFAEIIFGLTQKYAAENAGQHADDILEENDGNTARAVEDILGQDTQQIWIERAIRRLQVLRRRVDLHDLQVQRHHNNGYYDAECRKTIDLLFWLAVMCDTISAAMTERPLMVADEDSRNLSLAHPSHHDASAVASAPGALDTAKRWNVILAKDLQTKRVSLRWPCSDHDIAQELTDAAPVKVLLYRKVTRLQALVARDRDPTAIEEAIQDSLMVYTHWQAIYSGLFSDCVANHLLLSARTQSWYVCLFGHWLLATLLLVDLVEIVDQRGMGGTRQMRQRADKATVSNIRRSSVMLVSDLARASTPRHDDYGELETFHHAVNEGALLTEPWTMILLRTFSRTAIILLEGTVRLAPPPQTADSAEAPVVATEVERGNLERCENCVRALWYLGRKSDMAREVAGVLGVALQRERLKAIQ